MTKADLHNSNILVLEKAIKDRINKIKLQEDKKMQELAKAIAIDKERQQPKK